MAEPLKNYYNEQFYEQLASRLKAVYTPFSKKQFKTLIFDSAWENKELKERMRHTTQVLHQLLPNDYATTLQILTKVADGQHGFENMFFPDYVEVYGLEAYEKSIKALEFFTQQTSSEFAVRPFIVKYPEKMMEQMMQWAKHSNHHVRRLASEGCRPRLPWAMALPDFKKDPAPLLPILEVLKADPSEYVRRSVANNLNDIAKDHPNIVLEVVERWMGKHEPTNWICKHASRTLLKKGHPKALQLFGFAPPKNINIQQLTTDKTKVNIGDDIHFEFQLYNASKTAVKLRIEYAVYFMKANGKTLPKVFKITENTYAASSCTPFKRKHSFQNYSTRKHYPGMHELAVIVNGIEMEKIALEVCP